jgi:FkbM family methyltransferase
MLFHRLKSHLGHLKYQLSGTTTLGARRYRMRGYMPYRFAAGSSHEPNVQAAIARTLKECPGVFIDVGANCGQTLVAVLSADPQRHYVGFEPQIACCHYIEQFIKDNDLRQARILPIALSDGTRLLPFFSDSDHDLMASLSPSHRANQSTPARIKSFVCSRIGDEVLSELGIDSIAAIKIDVEGAELSVLKGLSVTLKRERPTLFFEVLPNFVGDDRKRLAEPWCVKNRAVAHEMYQLLASLDYKIFQLHERDGETPAEKFNLDDSDTFGGLNYVARAS